MVELAKQEPPTDNMPAALELWVKGCLKEQYGSVTREPLSPELMRLVDELAPGQ